MRKPSVFNITSSDKGKRIDRFLFEKGVSISRSQIKRLIDRGCVTVDGRPAKGGTACKVGQVVSISFVPEEIKEIKAEQIPLDIVYEDPQIILVNKPAGLVVHPAPGHRSGTLVNALLSKIKDLKPIMGEMRPGIVHRLDKETSGIMIVAKDERSLVDLADQFKKRTVQKVYKVAVVGDPPEKSIVSEKDIGRSRRDGKKMSVVSNGKGRKASTIFKVLEDFGGMTLMEARPRTGRTHQIRVHLANLGLPVVGDKLYLKGKMLSFVKDKELREKIETFPRQALHAYSLRFRHPRSNEEMLFEASLPYDMVELLDFAKSRK